MLASFCIRLQQAAARLKTAAGSRFTSAMIEDLEAEAAEVSKARATEAVHLECAGRGEEPPDMRELRRRETTAKAAEGCCKELGLPYVGGLQSRSRPRPSAAVLHMHSRGCILPGSYIFTAASILPPPWRTQPSAAADLTLRCALAREKPGM